MAAFDAAGDPGRFPEAGLPYQPLKLYYHATFSRAWLETIHEGAVARGSRARSPSGWSAGRGGGRHPELVVTAQVDVAAWLGRRRDALIAHATQIDPNSFWFAIPDEVTAEIYPWEDFTLAWSLVAVLGARDRPVRGD